MLHYFDVLRLLTVTTFKIVGFFTDTKTDIYIENGTSLDDGMVTPVSMPQQLSGNDWYMESFGLTVSFSLYGDLLGISEWAMREQRKCLKTGICQTSVQKKDEEEAREESQIADDGFAQPDDEVVVGW